jgi:hypothetical protein
MRLLSTGTTHNTVASALFLLFAAGANGISCRRKCFVGSQSTAANWWPSSIATVTALGCAYAISPGGERNGEIVKMLNRWKSLLIALSFLVPPNMWAAANRGLLHVSSPEEVAGQTVAPGDYVVQWDDSSPTVEARIMRGKQIIAVATVRAIPLDYISNSDSVVVDTVDGKLTLSQIFFHGKRVALEIQGQSQAMSASSR